LEIKPDFAMAHNNLGNTLRDLGRPVEAEASARRALEIKPDFAMAHNNLGNTLRDLGRLVEAEASYRRALELNPDYAEAHSNLGNRLLVLGRLVEAEASYRRALELKPDFLLALQSLSIIKGYQSDFLEVKALSDAALSLLPPSEWDRRTFWEMRLYILSYHPDLSAQEIFSEFVRWGDLQDCSATARRYENDRTPERRLRVGYVSPDFRRHTSRFYFEPLFSNHDRDGVELFAYSNVKTADDYTGRFKSLFDHWRDIAPLSDETAAELVRQDRIDILVDGCNHMRGERLGLFARKPAPVQMTWLGSAWTSGLPTMDYVLFDPYVAPAGTLAREAIVRVAHTFAVYRPPDDADPVGEAPCLLNGYVSFGYFGRTERLNHRVFRLWGRILASLPEARLVLDFRAFGDPATRDYYTGFLAKHGVDVTRVTMRCSQNVWQGLNDIDIMLDSFPHCGGTMSYDSLWMGVPLLTLASRPPLGRIGASIMSNLGLGEWVAGDEETYLSKAVSFSRNGAALAGLRRGMRERIAASPLRDEASFARAVERAYREMWRRWCAGEIVGPLDVAPEDEAKAGRTEQRGSQGGGADATTGH
jgi:predicted O-linked N-acetylglucosamine transferase (SPINDLY family)